ncbi:MAG: thymidylate synthase [Oscillospiraceae bacterium]|jgi:thymidylate synthase|nr:thymidylate synthase [Oscillospiraceae bacterium]
MFELFTRGNTLPEAYHSALEALHGSHDIVPCPDYNTTQKEASLTFVVAEPMREPMISRLFVGEPRSLEQYRQEMLDGILDFLVRDDGDGESPSASQEERGNWEYTYHARMADQIPWVVDELRRNPDSRRAVISTRDKRDMESGSPACLQSMQFFIRGEGGSRALHCKVLFRSNDAAKAAFMNAFALIMLQERIAKQLGVAVGSYTHRANSFHVYERDFELLDGYVNRIRSGAETTYSYVGDWDERMSDERDAIDEMVKSLRGR